MRNWETNLLIRNLETREVWMWVRLKRIILYGIV